MKFKTTAKAIRESGGMVVSAGYCDLYHVLINHSPVAYTCGVYGWNFDVYDVYGVTICTGYRGMVGKRANGIRECERLAKSIYYDDSIPYEEKRERIENVLKAFIKAQYEGRAYARVWVNLR